MYVTGLLPLLVDNHVDLDVAPHGRKRADAVGQKMPHPRVDQPPRRPDGFRADGRDARRQNEWGEKSADPPGAPRGEGLGHAGCAPGIQGRWQRAILLTPWRPPEDAGMPRRLREHGLLDVSDAATRGPVSFSCEAPGRYPWMGKESIGRRYNGSSCSTRTSRIGTVGRRLREAVHPGSTRAVRGPVTALHLRHEMVSLPDYLSVGGPRLCASASAGPLALHRSPQT